MAIARYSIYQPPRPELPHLVVMVVGAHAVLVGAAKTRAEAITMYQDAVLRGEQGRATLAAARHQRRAKPRKHMLPPKPAGA